MAEVPVGNSGADVQREDTSGDEAVREGEQPVTPEQMFRFGQLVSTRGGVRTAAEAAEMVSNPPAFRGQTHGKVNAQQGVHFKPPATKVYECADCADLEQRIKRAFKEMGYDF
jgi:hypothetical protein